MERRVIELAGESLLESSSVGTLDSLWQLAKDTACSSDLGIKYVVIKGNDGKPYSLSWNREIMQQILRDSLKDRILKLRGLLKLISLSKVPWFFVTDTDCFGDRLELALVCDSFLLFSSKAHIGFPEVEINMHPFLGALELAEDNGFSRSNQFWMEKPVISAREALEKKLVRFAVGYDRWWENIDIFTQGLLPSLDSILDPVSQEIGEIISMVENPVERNVSNTGSRNLTQILTDKRKGKSFCEYSLVVAESAAERILSRDYIRWYSRKSYGNCFRGENRLIDHSRIVIDLDRISPPKSNLLKLLEADIGVVFVCEDRMSLKQNLEVTYSKLEKSIDEKRLQDYWSRVIWALAENVRINVPTLTWTIDDRIVYSVDNEESFLWRVAGNSRDAEIGLCEIGRIKSDEALRFLCLLCDGVIETQTPNEGVPVVHIIRSLVLEEIVGLAYSLNSTADQIVEVLAAEGWNFIGSAGAIGRFLRVRHNDDFMPRKINYGRGELNQNFWEMSSWKEVRNLFKGRATVGKSVINQYLVNDYFAIFSGVLALDLHSKGYVATHQDADLMVSQAFGFPESLGIPSEYILSVGLSKVSSYIHENWSHRFESKYDSDGLWDNCEI